MRYGLGRAETTWAGNVFQEHEMIQSIETEKREIT